MSYLEDDLKMALRREEPPEDFAGRVLARVAAPAKSQASWWRDLGVIFRPPRVQWVALSVMASMLIPVATIQYRKEQRLRVEGQMAKQRLVFAVRIAGSKLHGVQQKVLEMSQTENRL